MTRFRDKKFLSLGAHFRMVLFLIIMTASGVSLIASRALAAESSSDISDRLSRQQDDLNKAREDLALVNQQMAVQAREIDRNRNDLADATSLLREAEDEYRSSLKRFSDRISAIYKLGESQFYAVLLASEDFSDAMSRLGYLGTISENDLRLVERLKAEEVQVRALRERVDGLKQDSVDDINALVRRQEELQKQIATGNTNVDRDRLELARAQTREAEEAALRADEDTLSLNGYGFGGFVGPSILVGSSPPAGLVPSGVVLSGQASWYGPGFHGNRTANGETYNMYALTAAHKTLPFGTWLKVTYNGRSVFVRINDRGPYVGGRFLDLSAGSAQAIGLSGVGYVTAEIYH